MNRQANSSIDQQEIPSGNGHAFSVLQGAKNYYLVFGGQYHNFSVFSSVGTIDIFKVDGFEYIFTSGEEQMDDFKDEHYTCSFSLQYLTISINFYTKKVYVYSVEECDVYCFGTLYSIAEKDGE